MATSRDSTRQPNHLLDALRVCEPEHLDADLRPAELVQGQVLYECWRPRNDVYFPMGSVISLVYETSEGRSSELAVIGSEGMLGIRQLAGGGATPLRAIVQGTGWAFRMRGVALRDLFESNATARDWLLRYAQALFAQVAQTAVCNRHHSIEQQLCRWILTMLDRVPADELAMTHEQMSRMLGVRREGVTEAAGKLQQLGAIRYWRGRVEVPDREKLQSLACECYGVVNRQFAELLPWATGASR